MMFNQNLGKTVGGEKNARPISVYEQEKKRKVSQENSENLKLVELKRNAAL